MKGVCSREVVNTDVTRRLEFENAGNAVYQDSPADLCDLGEKGLEVCLSSAGNGENNNTSLEELSVETALSQR